MWVRLSRVSITLAIYPRNPIKSYGDGLSSRTTAKPGLHKPYIAISNLPGHGGWASLDNYLIEAQTYFLIAPVSERMNNDLLTKSIVYVIAGIGFCTLGIQIFLRAPRNDATLEMLVMYSGIVVALLGLLLILLGRNHFREVANPERVREF